MTPLLHFGLIIQDGPELKKHHPSYTMLKTSLNPLKPVLDDEYIVTIQNDDEHSYGKAAYTLLLQIPERVKPIEIDRVEPENHWPEIGSAVLFTMFEFSTMGKTKETLDHSILGSVPNRIQGVCFKLLSRLEEFFGEQYTFSFDKGIKKEIAFKLKKDEEQDWKILREFDCPHSDIDIETRQLCFRALYRYFKEHPNQ